MIIAVSGYNASGKSTVVSHLHKNLAQSGIDVSVQRFATLYPGAHFGKRLPERKPANTDGRALGLRSIEAQRGEWDQPMSWTQFANVVVASILVRFLALRSRRRIVILDRFLYDRLIHFDPKDWRLRIAKAFCFRPAITLVLIPSIKEHESRFLDRVSQRHGVRSERMSEEDRNELQMVHQRYREIADQKAECVVIDSADSKGLDAALLACVDRLPQFVDRATVPSSTKQDV